MPGLWAPALNEVELSLNEKKKKNLYVLEEEAEETKRRK